MNKIVKMAPLPYKNITTFHLPCVVGHMAVWHSVADDLPLTQGALLRSVCVAGRLPWIGCVVGPLPRCF